MIVNQIGYKEQIGILKRLTSNKFSYYQDTPDQKIWESLGGSKDDVFIYNTEGELVQHIKSRPGEGEPGSHMGSGKEMCKDADSIPTIKILLAELEKIVNEQDGKVCNDEFDRSFEEIFKLRNARPMKKLTAEEREAKKKERKEKIEMAKKKRLEEKKKKKEMRLLEVEEKKKTKQIEKEMRKNLKKEERQKKKIEKKQRKREEKQKRKEMKMMKKAEKKTKEIENEEDTE